MYKNIYPESVSIVQPNHYNNYKNNESELPSLMSFVILSWSEYGTILASDTRSIRMEKINGNINYDYDDQYQKIHKIKDNLYLAITGENDFDKQSISQIILNQKIESITELENYIRNNLLGKSKTLYVLFEFNKDKINYITLNSIFKKSNNDIIEKYDCSYITEYKSIIPGDDNSFNFCAFGAPYATSALANINFAENNYKPEELLIKTKEILNAMYNLSELTEEKVINSKWDIYFYNAKLDKIKCIEKNSVKESIHTIFKDPWEGLL